MKRNKLNQTPDYSNKEIKLVRSDDWRTPQWLFDHLDKEFKFAVDLAASKDNHKLDEYYTKEDSALQYKWMHDSFANYPYSAPTEWFNQALSEVRQWDNTVVFLAKVATSENYWCANVKHAHVRFIHSRIKFWDDNNTPHYGASFSSAVVIWSPQTLNNPKSEYWDYTPTKAEKLF